MKYVGNRRFGEVEQTKGNIAYLFGKKNQHTFSASLCNNISPVLIHFDVNLLTAC